MLRRWIPLAAAACVAAVAVIVAIAGLPKASQNGQASGRGERPLYLVADGDRVEVTGMVIAAPGQPVIYCPPLLSPARPSSAEAPECGADLAVTLTGVDVGALVKPTTTSAGVTFGYARVRGIWQSRTIAVDEQSAPPMDALTGPPDNDTVPCPAPAGGWPVPDPPRRQLPSADAVKRYVDQHPDRFGAAWVAFPEGMNRPTAAWTVPAVLVVTVLDGAVDEARNELQPLYDGTLCVSRSGVTRTRLVAAAKAGETLLLDTRNGIWVSSGVGPTDELTAREGPIEVHLLVVDDRLFAEYERIGLDLFDLRPAITRVG